MLDSKYKYLWMYTCSLASSGNLRILCKFGLNFKAQLECLTNLHPEGEDFRWYLKLKCGNCGEVPSEFQYLTLEENSPLKGGRGHASLVVKCKLCSRENSIDIMKDTIKPYNEEDSGQFKTIVVFDCRGIEPVDFDPRIGFVANGLDSTSVFDDVDLTERIWADYDDKKQRSVSVDEISWTFVVVK